MMEEKGSVVVAMDWRAEVKDETRRKVVNHILTKLKDQWSACSLNPKTLKEITDIAVKFESEMFNKAKSQDQYALSITRKMCRVEKQHENSRIQNPPSSSSGKSVVQIKKENVSQPLPQMTNQPYQQPAAPNPRHQQPAAPNPRHQQPAVTNPPLQLNIQHLTPQPREQLQHRQNLTARRTHQQFGMHNQSCVRPQITLSSPYRPLDLQSRDSGIRVSQEIFTPNENLTAQVKKEVMGEDFQSSTLLHQHHSVTEQHKQHQSVGGSADPIENPNVEEWHDRVYFEIQAFKGKYLPMLKEAYEMTSKQCQRVGQTEQIQKLKNHIGLMQRMMNFLELPRNRMVNYTKEKVYHYMHSVAQYVKSLENRNMNVVNKQQPLHGQPGLSQSHMNPVQRSHNFNTHSQPVNLGTSSSPDSSPMALRQMGSVRPEANRIQKNLLQKRQHSENAKQEFQSPWIQQKQKSTVNSQAINSSGVSSEYRLNSKCSPQTPVTPSNFLNEASQLSQIAERALPIDSSTSSYGRASPIPSSFTAGLGIKSSNVSCLPNSNFQYPQTSNAVNLLNTGRETQVQSHEIRTCSTLTSRLGGEPSCPGTNQQLLTTTQPLNRLLKAVESMSDEALRAAVSEISSVGNMNDTTTEPSPFETMCHQKAAHLSLQDGCCDSSNNMKRKISATTLNDMSSPCSDIHGSQPSVCQIDGLDSTVTSRSKKHKKLTDDALLDEMRNINQQLVETVLELDSPENVDRRLANAGTVLRCAYSAITDSKNLKFHCANTQKLPVLSVQLLVPIDYPEDYPVFLSRFTTDSCSSSEDEESKELSRKATSMLHARLRTTPERLSLEDIARAWDQCARAVVSEYAQRAGGGCFSSRYGTWEDCVAAT